MLFVIAFTLLQLSTFYPADFVLNHNVTISEMTHNWFPMKVYLTYEFAFLSFRISAQEL